MSDLEPDWDTPLSLSLTPTAIFTVLFASADEVHTAWQSCVDSALVVGENMARDEGSANYCRLVEQEYEEDGSVGPWHDWCVAVRKWRKRERSVAVTLPSRAGARPKRRSTRLALGESWMPAPAVRWAAACSSTMTS